MEFHPKVWCWTNMIHEGTHKHMICAQKLVCWSFYHKIQLFEFQTSLGVWQSKCSHLFISVLWSQQSFLRHIFLKHIVCGYQWSWIHSHSGLEIWCEPRQIPLFSLWWNVPSRILLCFFPQFPYLLPKCLYRFALVIQLCQSIFLHWWFSVQ